MNQTPASATATNFIEISWHACEQNLKAENAPGTEAIVEDALTQLEKLETEYKKLQKDLRNSGQDERVIYAMISNFQQRIDLLKQVLDQIENIKSLKNKSDENYI